MHCVERFYFLEMSSATNPLLFGPRHMQYIIQHIAVLTIYHLHYRQALLTVHAKKGISLFTYIKSTH